jgi:glycosyltransferase involved in cell wall biosynthesis
MNAMRILVHDYSGHPFQAQLSRELSSRGHHVTHSYCAAYVSGRGCLHAEPGEALVFEPIAVGETLAKLSFGKRLLQELRFGLLLVGQVRRVRPEVVLAANVPIPTLVLLVAYLLVRRVPWVLWHQDVQAVALRSFAGEQLPRAFSLAAALIGLGERWCARRSAAVVVIAESFLAVHQSWRTASKVTVIPNWAPLDEIYQAERKNDWAVEHELDDVPTLLYSGTLGLKHNPALLPQLARKVIDAGSPVRLVVVNTGPAEQVVADEARRLDVPLTLLPFQPYDRLPEVLGSGDVLVVLLEQDAGAFSVPSKTLSYLCAGRPVLGLMPAENLAAQLVSRVDGLVLPPDAESLTRASEWVTSVLADPQRVQELGYKARALAELEFGIDKAADQFEAILADAVAGHRSRGPAGRERLGERAPSDRHRLTWAG